jgi:hypothetical protein
MAFTPADPFPKSRGDTVRSADWNEAVNELLRLEGDKVNRDGDTIEGPLTVEGALQVAAGGTQRQLLVGGDVAGIGLDPADVSPNAGYIRFGDNSGWKLHFGRSRENPGDPLNASTTGVLTALDEGATTNGAWANLGSNSYFDGSWKRIDTTKAGVSLHMNADDGSGQELRFRREEADGSNPRNLAVFGRTTSFIAEGNFGIGTSAPFARLGIDAPAAGNDARFGAQIHAIGAGSGTKLGLWSTAEGGGTKYGGVFNASTDDGGTAHAVVANAFGGGSGTKFGILSSVSGAGTLWAGFFVGNVHITGTLSKQGGGFLIDHPEAPDDKTLRHNFVESPEHLCVYRGKVTLNARGRATVRLPRYFAALTDEQAATVHLTPVGREPSPASYQWNQRHTAVTVFGPADAEVAYLVLAARDDPVVRQLERPVEEAKGNGNFEKGRLLNPEAFGRPPEMGVAFQAQTVQAALRPPASPEEGS